MPGLNNKKYLDAEGLIKFWEICCANFPARDGRGASGNWNIKAATAGTADEAIKLKTARKITIAGAVTGKADFDGSDNITISTGVNHTHNKLYQKYAQDARPESADITVAGDGTLSHFKATSVMTTGKPADVGHILHFEWDNAGGHSSQLYIPITTSTNYAIFPQWRTTKAGSATQWLNWDTFLTTGNYSTYALPLSGGTLTGNLTAPTFIGALQGNAATASSAAKLTTTRKLWGQNFNGEADVLGSISGVTAIYSNKPQDGSYNIFRIVPYREELLFQAASNDGKSKTGQIAIEGFEGAYLTRLRIAATNTAIAGNVTIGSTTASERLDVNGNVKATKFIGALQGNADSATSVSSFTTASSGDVTKRYVWMSWNDNSSKPAYTDKLTFQTSTNTLFSDKFAGNLTGNVTGNVTGNLTGVASHVDCVEAATDVDRPILVTNESNELRYSSKVKLNYSTGNVTAHTFTGNLVGTAAQTTGTLTLKTPAETITFNGSANKTFEVTAAKLGLTKAVLYLGKSTTAITDGGTEKPTIDGSVVNTLTAGNIVIDSSDSREYIWNGSKWEKFGLDGDAAAGNYKPIQQAVGDPTASGSSTTFIDTIAQDANGKITATKKSVNFSGYATTAQLANYLPLAGGTLTDALKIESTNWGGQLNLNRINNGDNWGPSIMFYADDSGLGAITMQDNELYVSDVVGHSRTAVSKVGHTHDYLPLSGGTITGTTTFNEEVKMIHAGSSDICVGIACDFKSNRSQISNLITNYIYLGKESTDKNIRFRSYSSISSTAPASPTDLLVISSSGCTAPNFITNSDIRLKKNINEIANAAKSLELNFYEFDYVNNDNHSAGHIAQEVREVLPEFVHGKESETEHLSIDYTGLHSVQIKALKDKVETLEIENKAIKAENKELLERLEKLEALIEKLI